MHFSMNDLTVHCIELGNRKNGSERERNLSHATKIPTQAYYQAFNICNFVSHPTVGQPLLSKTVDSWNPWVGWRAMRLEFPSSQLHVRICVSLAEQSHFALSECMCLCVCHCVCGYCEVSVRIFFSPFVRRKFFPRACLPLVDGSVLCDILRWRKRETAWK